MLVAAGWVVQDYKAFNPSAGRGIALREVPLKSGTCDYFDAFLIGLTATPSKQLSGARWRGRQVCPKGERGGVRQTIGFFIQNLVMDLSSSEKPSAEGEARRVSAGCANPYSHERAAADGANAGYEVYRIKTQIAA